MERFPELSAFAAKFLVAKLSSEGLQMVLDRIISPEQALGNLHFNYRAERVQAALQGPPPPEAVFGLEGAGGPTTSQALVRWGWESASAAWVAEGSLPVERHGSARDYLQARQRAPLSTRPPAALSPPV